MTKIITVGITAKYYITLFNNVSIYSVRKRLLM